MNESSKNQSTLNYEKTPNTEVTKVAPIKTEVANFKSPYQESKAIDIRAEVLVEPKAHTIRIESDTDWPTVIATSLVGVAGILTTLLVGWFAHAVQKNQIRSNTASFRHAWQIQLREKMSDFVAKIAILHYKSKRTKYYFDTPDSDIEYSDLLKIQATIMLMLDPNKDYAKQINNLMDECNTLLKNSSIKELNTKINELTNKANEILELAWTDIKNDLGVGL